MAGGAEHGTCHSFDDDRTARIADRNCRREMIGDACGRELEGEYSCPEGEVASIERARRFAPMIDASQAIFDGVRFIELRGDRFLAVT